MGRDNCIFCQIIDKKISAELVYEDDELAAFRDINPQAPEHILIVPKQHIAKLSEMQDDEMPLIGKMYALAKKIAKENHFDETGYRLVLNEGKNGGQTIFHIHVHLLAGRRLMWPPG